jgi:inorganic pyrophosphatase
MNLLHSIKARETESTINVIIEVPTGSQTKIEYDFEKELFFVNRVLYTKLSYPFNYGFIPETWEGDNNPLDVVVLCSQPISTGLLIECRLIGMLSTKDEEGTDTKMLAVPSKLIDSDLSKVNTIDDLDEATLSLIQRFYKNYKIIEPEKWVDINGLFSQKEAEVKLNEAINSYHNHFNR